jgi:hypothetical protein
MYWEIWDLVSRNMQASETTEAAALAVVRRMMAEGWTADELVLLVDDPALADEDLPPGVTGEELARRAGAADPNSTRRTA